LAFDVYQENQVLPIIARRFGKKLGVDSDALEKKVAEIRSFAL
jgi:hypothetical protein